MSTTIVRTAPTNYLLTAAAGGLLWAVLAVGLGGHLGNIVPLQERTTEQFLVLYRIALGVAVLVGLANCFYWYFQGSRRQAAVNLRFAQRLWVSSLLAQIVFAVTGLLAVVLLLQAEGLSLGNFAVIFVAFSLLTYVFFWAATLVASPPAVEFIPIGKR
jgi:hypothetical protein